MIFLSLLLGLSQEGTESDVSWEYYFIESHAPLLCPSGWRGGDLGSTVGVPVAHKCSDLELAPVCEHGEVAHYVFIFSFLVKVSAKGAGAKVEEREEKARASCSSVTLRKPTFCTSSFLICSP